MRRVLTHLFGLSITMCVFPASEAEHPVSETDCFDPDSTTLEEFLAQKDEAMWKDGHVCPSL